MPAKKKTTTEEVKITPKKTSKKEQIEATVVSDAVKTPKGLSVDVFDIKGGKTTMTLPAEIFGVKVNKQLMAQAVRVYLANQRMGGAKAQTRGEVRGSTRKIYQQKGTGRARHGGIRAPIFVGGGAAHGPRPHDFSLSFPKKMRKQALFSALSSKKEQGSIVVVKGLGSIDGKTKAMVTVLNTLALTGKKQKSIMLVLPSISESQANVTKAARNIAGISLLAAVQLNTYEVLKAHTLVFMQEAIEGMKGVSKK